MISRFPQNQDKHFKTITHKSQNESIMRRNINLNPNFDEIEVTGRRYMNKHNEKYVEYDVRYVLKLLTTTNCVRYIRVNPKSNLEYSFCFSKELILSRINQDRYYFPQIFELRISFISSIIDMTFDCYLEQSKSMCEIKLMR